MANRVNSFNIRGLRQRGPIIPDVVYHSDGHILNSLIAKADEDGLLQPLERPAGYRLFLYADDVALFIRPDESELQVTKDILNTFGKASGLKTNLEKSCIIILQCVEDTLTNVTSIMPCSTAEFPCTYVGLPLSNKEL